MSTKTLCCDQSACHDYLQLGWRAPRGRIAMISMHTCPLAMLGGKNTGGMNVYVRELSRELGRRGWAVDIFTHAQSSERPAVIHMARNVRVIHVQAGPVQHVDKNELFQYVPEFAENIVEMAAEAGIYYDVIYSHYWLSGLVAERLREVWDVPFIQMFHTLGKMKNRVAQRIEERELDLRIRSETRLMHSADRLIAANPIDRQHMLDLYRASPGKIEVVPCGVDLSLFRPIPQEEAREELGVPEDKKLLVFVGRIEPLKGIDTLLHAIAQVVKVSPEWRKHLILAIIGGSSEDDAESMTAEMRRLRDLREELGIRDVVCFLGAQAQETLPYFYAAAEAVIMPSHYESFGMVALEATACGTPVIASEVGGLTYTINDGENGFLISPKRPDLLADKVLQLLENPQLRRRMGRLGTERAIRFGWPAVADQILATVRDLRKARAA
ncbi:MAG: glycosyltransferase [Chloroflexota bacterium]|nr:glycosyltransferase [Chloroflexota bacterium]